MVVESRVFVRSWTLEPHGWYRTLRDEPRGVIEVAKKRLRFRAVFTRSERLLAAVDRAYLAKFRTPWAQKLARGFKNEKAPRDDHRARAALGLRASARARPARA